MYIISVLLMINVIIMIHEYGHLTIAKKLGMNPTVFGVGFGKTLKKFKGSDGILYKINLLPLGGYVNFNMKEFKKEKAWKRFLMFLGGVGFNLISVIFVCFLFVILTKMPLFRTSTDADFNVFKLFYYTFVSVIDSFSLIFTEISNIFLSNLNLNELGGPILLITEGATFLETSILLGLP